jgi:hypothetical protein
VGSCALVLALLFGCGGATAHNPDGEPPGPAAGTAGTVAQGASSAGGSASRAGSGGMGSSAGSRNLGGGGAGTDPPPVTSGCKPEDMPPPRVDCDPFGANTCGDGAGCYPFVEHPEGSGCGAQVYGTRCLPTGFGTQGQLCGEEVGDWCSGGHVCVVGQRAGKRCAELCEPGVPDQCSGGLICGDLDVAGFGVCG